MKSAEKIASIERAFFSVKKIHKFFCILNVQFRWKKLIHIKNMEKEECHSPDLLEVGGEVSNNQLHLISQLPEKKHNIIIK